MSHSNQENNGVEIKFTIGLDEAGRGCWAGPIVAGAVLGREGDFGTEIKDSKKIKEKERYQIAFKLMKTCQYGIGLVSPEVIDKHGLSFANALAFERALRHLLKKTKIPPNTKIVIDGRKQPVKAPGFQKIEFFEKGESKFKTIAAASIIAKVYRDTLLNNRSQKEPQWHWDKHKGYGTLLHRNLIELHGIIPKFHRLSYRPLQRYL